MKLKKLVLAVSLTTMAYTGTAYALSINDLILQEKNNFGFTVLTDESAESVYVRKNDGSLSLKQPEVDGSIKLEKNDVLRGIFRISDIGTQSVQATTGHELTGIFELEVLTANSGAPACGLSSFCFTFGPSSSFSPAGFSVGLGNSSNAMLALYDDTLQDFKTAIDTGSPAVDIANMEATATNGVPFWLFAKDNIDDFWKAGASTNNVASPLLGPDNRFVNFNFGVSQINDPAAQGLALESWACQSGTTSATVDMCGSGTVRTKTTTELSAYHLMDDFSFTVKAEIPEPATVALLGIGLLGFGTSRLRKKA